MIGWVLNLVYALLLAAVAPVVAWRAWRHGRYRRGWSERVFGALPRRLDPTRPLAWLHAVSVGEIVLANTLVRAWRDRRPDLQFLVTTSTDSGFDLARRELDGCDVAWMPLDFTWAVRRAIARVQPDAIVLVELEIWPNLIREAARTGVPLALVNSRLGERSFRGYRRVRGLMAPLLKRFHCIAAQTSEHAARFVALGAEAGRVVVTGSMKFDGAHTDRENPRTTALRELLDLSKDEPVFIAGSTQAPEEEAALIAWMAARRRHPALRLVLAPRHRERFDAVAELIARRGLPLLRRSEIRAESHELDGGSPVILLDTIGELSSAWGLADIAYVGGSLTPGRGGQNMLEPAAFGAAVLLGPHTENFKAIVEALLSRQAARVVGSEAALQTELLGLLDDPARRRELGRRARELVLSQQGATLRTLDHLAPLLPAAAPRLHRAA